MLCHIKLNIYTQKTKFTSHKQYLLRLLFSRNAKKKNLKQTRISNLQTVKRDSYKSFFSSMYVFDATCFDECFLVYVTTRRHYDLYNLLLLSFYDFFQKQSFRGVLRTPMPKCDFKKVGKEITFQHGYSPANLLHIFKTTFT